MTFPESTKTLLLTARSRDTVGESTTPPPMFAEDMEAQLARPPYHDVDADTSDDEITRQIMETMNQDPSNDHAPSSARAPVQFSVDPDNPEDAHLCSLLYHISPYSHDELSHAFSVSRRQRAPTLAIIVNETQTASQMLAVSWGTAPEMEQLGRRAVVWVCNVHDRAMMSSFGAIASRIPGLNDEMGHHIQEGLLHSPSVFLFAPGSQKNELWYAEYGCDPSTLNHLLLILDEHNAPIERSSPPPEISSAAMERDAERAVIRSEYEAALEEDRKRDAQRRQQEAEEDAARKREQAEKEKAESLQQYKVTMAEGLSMKFCGGTTRVAFRKRDGQQHVVSVPADRVTLLDLIQYAFTHDTEAKIVEAVTLCTTYPRNVFSTAQGTTLVSELVSKGVPLNFVVEVDKQMGA
eukprot:PhF_6_TR26324/c0_g1_i2/m.37846